MKWLDEVVPASFRTVPFVVRSTNKRSGRRLVTHQYPRLDLAHNEDLGAATTVYTLNCFVIGNDYLTNKKNLERALDEGGNGILSHPYYGHINVAVDSYSVSESSGGAGKADFSITFVEEIDNEITVSVNVVKQLEIVSNALFTANEDWMEAEYSLELQPYASIADARETLDSSFSFIDNAKQSAASTAQFKRNISNAKGAVIGLSMEARAIAFTYQGLVMFGIGETLDASPRDQMRELKKIFDATATPYVTTSGEVSTEASYPAKQIQTSMAYATVAAMTSLVPLVSYGSVEDTAEQQQEIYSLIDALAFDPNVNDGVYEALIDCRTTVFTYFQDIDIGLPRLVDHVLPQGDNALSFAYRTYGDITKADEVVTMNGIHHPGFLPQGVTLRLKTYE